MKTAALLFVFILSVTGAPAVLAADCRVVQVAFGPSAPCEDEITSRGGEAEVAERLTIRNPQGVALGEIVNFLMDTSVGKVAYALVDTGGEMAEEDLRLVPVNALQIENEQIILNVDEKQLADAPAPAPGQNPEDYHRGLAEYFGVAPYWEE
ncbi:MAG: PRC-barrel domain-containing protein [Desulfuromonadales bacterium]|nr:PRC-barrel domain-containing protein [Desulfuromonadales bacterium]